MIRTGDLRPSDNEAITGMFGCSDWHAIWQAKLNELITPSDAFAEYVNLMRWRLEKVLGYKWTHQLVIRNLSNRPIYHMIFATYSDPGHGIMTHLYDQAATEFPVMANEARGVRDRLRMEAHGQYGMFPGLDVSLKLPPTSVPSGTKERFYVHEPPDEPREHDQLTCPYCE